MSAHLTLAGRISTSSVALYLSTQGGVVWRKNMGSANLCVSKTRSHICDIVWYPDSIGSKILLICSPFLVKHSLFHSQRPNIAGVERSIHQYAVIYRSPAIVITNEQLYHWQSDIIPIRTRSALKTKGTNRMIMCTYVVHKWAWKRSMQNTTALPWLFYHADMLTMQTWSK